MMRFTVFALVAAFFVVVALVHAQDCNNPQTQAEMNQCATKDHEAATRELNEIYNKYRDRLNKEQKEGIQEVQHAWMRFCDLTCRFESSGVEGGSAYGSLYQVV
jgi:uncharacterized protein YecT (DUF1311 family)